MKNLIILRGLPGSGKSTFAEQLAPPEHICCHDEFLYVDGKYVFTKERHDNAKTLSLAKFTRLLQAGVERIVFTGVSPDATDAHRYAIPAKAAGYQITWLIVENSHGGQTLHGVPDETIDEMRKSFIVKL